MTQSERRLATAKADSRQDQCYNCKSKEHYQDQCLKSRVVCSKCNLLGHEGGKCHVSTLRQHPDVNSKGNH
nr:unnamed protein product [Callosobruchus chinensis]